MNGVRVQVFDQVKYLGVVSLSFFSDSVALSEKGAMVKPLLHHSEQSSKIVLQEMLLLTDNVSIVLSCWKLFLDITSASECRPWLFKSIPKVLATT